MSSEKALLDCFIDQSISHAKGRIGTILKIREKNRLSFVKNHHLNMCLLFIDCLHFFMLPGAADPMPATPLGNERKSGSGLQSHTHNSRKAHGPARTALHVLKGGRPQ